MNLLDTLCVIALLGELELHLQHRPRLLVVGGLLHPRRHIQCMLWWRLHSSLNFIEEICPHAMVLEHAGGGKHSRAYSYHGRRTEAYLLPELRVIVVAPLGHLSRT